MVYNCDFQLINQVRLRRKGNLICLLDNTFSSKKQPVKDGEATEGLRP
jgi:hypothetical protein